MGAPLDESDAHDLANMIRAKAGIHPETGKIHGIGIDGDNDVTSYIENGGRAPSAEDLDRAYVEIEELKRCAKEDLPRVANLLHDIFESGSQAASILQGVLGITSIDTQHITGESLIEKIRSRWRAARQISDLDTIFRDAQNQLEFIRARGARFGEQEELHDVN